VCNREAPEVAQLARDYEGRVTFVGVGAFDSIDRLQAFVDEHDLHHFPHAVSEDGALFVRVDLSYHPAWGLLDADGEVVLRGVRPSLPDVRDALDALADA
jgi:hypothetical protein